ncbi:uncharacterized protein LACBIDRAFT_318754 [Laccaria bicolor S238N-H82]|uniref:Predicted protein n=1 Tax=Laccaria bicolor (strain S238N-H82 / ATCC MYA-4686) TaxID=486041 RepID=B0D704_LACBS|nr:uncharacterized protein LACBIDRAFT_318754 [Laccaria bicolor S238N-H82]EDR09566.1 predicted protein [Laccaria bicolor S238N-H82]|eukprot:XP_001879915.1 predicted protein [Laccaria bicolor S238N-H82]
MRSFLTIFTLLIGSTLTSAMVARDSTPFNTPCALYTCPLTDQRSQGLLLSDSSASSDLINCTYALRPTYHLCVYSKTTGVLTADNDAGNCPSKAVCSTSSRRRRDALPQSPRLRSSVARQVDTSPLKARSQLGSAKRAK